MKKLFVIFIILFSTAISAQIPAELDSLWIRQVDANHIQVEIKSISTLQMLPTYSVIRIDDTIKVDVCVLLGYNYPENDTIYKRYTIPVDANHSYTLKVKEYQYDYVNYICLNDENLVFGTAMVDFATPLASEISVEGTTPPPLKFTEDDIALSPNPVRDKLYIRNKSSAQIKEIEIYDTQGQLYRKQKSAGTEYISLDNLPSGLYLLRLYTDKGIITRKFQVKKE